jgi:hypothetical protein
MSKISQPTSFAQIPQAQLAQYLDIFAQSVVSTVNGNLDFGNFNAQIITANFATDFVEYGFPHTLGRVPVGYIRVGGNFDGAIWENTQATWTANKIYLLCGSAGYAKLLLF